MKTTNQLETEIEELKEDLDGIDMYTHSETYDACCGLMEFLESKQQELSLRLNS